MMGSGLSRRHFVGAAGALSVPPALAAGRRHRRVNVLLIVVDQWSAVASEVPEATTGLHTPAVNSLASNGMRFGNCYCTYPLCSPSRASLFSGQWPHAVNVIFNVAPNSRLAENMPTLGSAFSEAGYATGYFGKEHTGGIAYRGFQNRGSIEFPKAGYLASGSTLDSVFVRDAIAFIQAHRRDPFLAVVSLINPHDIGYTVPSEPIPNKSMVDLCGAFDMQAGKYLRGRDLPPLPPNFHPSAPPEMSHPLLRRLHTVQENWTERDWRLYLATYYLLIENTDWLIGRVLDAVRAAGLEEDTLILFTADHGDQMAAHHLVGKFVFYEEAARVPFVLSWKGLIPPGQVNRRHLISGLDVLPTLCDFAGVPVPHGPSGRSVRSLVEGKQPAWRPYLVSELHDGRMVRTESHKYVVFRRDQTSEFLFDLRNDPGETRNLAGDPGSQSALQTGRELLNAWMRETGGAFEQTRETEEMRHAMESMLPASERK